MEGVRELVRMLERGEKAPAKVLTSAAKTGAKKMLNAVKTNAKTPELTGDLKKSLGYWAEKRKSGKRVYWVTFNRKYNDKFSKYKKGSYTNLTTKKLVGKRYYYPASQEYGFKLRNGGKKEGLYFLRDSLKNNRGLIEVSIVKEIVNSLRALGW
jgi:hypothetical protein